MAGRKKGGQSMNKTKLLTTTALMTAVLCILGPISIPIGPVPISLVNMAIYVTMYILDAKRGTIAVCLYLLIGLIGVPVFSGAGAGPAKLIGPTGGYLIGYIPMAIVIGLVVDRIWRKKIACMAVMEAATWIPYLLGSLWLSVQSHMTFTAAFAVGVLPFLIEDLVKIVIVGWYGPLLRTRLARFTSLQLS